MKNLLLSSLFLLSFFSNSVGQTPGVQWQKKLNNFLPNSNVNIIYGMSKVKSGGFIFAGTDTLYGLDSARLLNKELGSRPYITRTDNEGNIIWSTNLPSYIHGGFYNCVIQSGNDEFITAGLVADYPEEWLTVSKYKKDGALAWNKNFGALFMIVPTMLYKQMMEILLSPVILIQMIETYLVITVKQISG